MEFLDTLRESVMMNEFPSHTSSGGSVGQSGTLLTNFIETFIAQAPTLLFPHLDDTREENEQ